MTFGDDRRFVTDAAATERTVKKRRRGPRDEESARRAGRSFFGADREEARPRRARPVRPKIKRRPVARVPRDYDVAAVVPRPGILSCGRRWLAAQHRDLGSNDMTSVFLCHGVSRSDLRSATTLKTVIHIVLFVIFNFVFSSIDTVSLVMRYNKCVLKRFINFFFRSFSETEFDILKLYSAYYDLRIHRDREASSQRIGTDVHQDVCRHR